MSGSRMTQGGAKGHRMESTAIVLPDEMVCAVLDRLSLTWWPFVARASRQWFRCVKEMAVADHVWVSRHLLPPLLCTSIMNRMAAKGHARIVLWMRTRAGIPWTGDTMEAACLGGHERLVRRMLRPSRSMSACPTDARCLMAAAIGGHAPIAQRIRATGQAWSEAVLCAALLSGRPDVVRRLTALGCPGGRYAVALAVAMGNRSLMRALAARHRATATACHRMYAGIDALDRRQFFALVFRHMRKGAFQRRTVLNVLAMTLAMYHQFPHDDHALEPRELMLLIISCICFETSNWISTTLTDRSNTDSCALAPMSLGVADPGDTRDADRLRRREKRRIELRMRDYETKKRDSLSVGHAHPKTASHVRAGGRRRSIRMRPSGTRVLCTIVAPLTVIIYFCFPAIPFSLSVQDRVSCFEAKAVTIFLWALVFLTGFRHMDAKSEIPIWEGDAVIHETART